MTQHPQGDPSKKRQSATNKRLTMALVYDFDGTLAPGNVQEPQFIPNIGMKPADFWKKYPIWRGRIAPILSSCTCT